MLGLYLLGQNSLHLTLKPYCSSATNSRKYVKLPNKVIHACKHITEKMNLVKICALQIRLCVFTFRPIAPKQLNSLITIVTLSWLGGAEVTHPLWVREASSSFPGSGQGFYVWFFGLLLLCVITQFCNFFCNINLFRTLNIWLDLWPIIRVYRYRPSIFNFIRNALTNTTTF